jgi:hypothetical protein
VASLPYDVTTVKSAPAPAHDLEVALVELRDRRLATEGPGASDRFIYRGLEYRGTLVDDLGIDPMAVITEVVARHLAKARVFARVYVVDEPGRAPADVDLFAFGDLVRLRGYVEAEPPPEDSGRDPKMRKVVAEAKIARFELRASPAGPALARFGVGWSFHDLRSAEPRPPDPWAVAAEVLRPALDQLVVSARRARLDGRVRVDEARWGPEPPRLSTRLKRAFSSTATSPAPALEALTPPGWAFEVTSSATSPADWARRGPPCAEGQWRATQEHRFLRRLGPYVPTVELWWCPPGTSLAWEAEAEFPALFIGRDAAGRRWLARQVGPSSWPGAPEAFARAVRLRPPEQRHRFRLGPGEGGANRSRPGG